MKAVKQNDAQREAARQAYLKRRAYFASIQIELEKNFNTSRSEGELLTADAATIRAHLSRTA
jgi:hypothetical protein